MPQNAPNASRSNGLDNLQQFELDLTDIADGSTSFRTTRSIAAGVPNLRIAAYPPRESDTDNTCLVESGNPLAR